MKPKITQLKFIQDYLKNSGSILDFYEQNPENFIAVPCDCEEDGCAGWQMLSMALLEDWVKFKSR